MAVSRRTTTSNHSRVTPESTQAVEEKKEESKTIKVKMCALYISDSYILNESQEYELPSALANELIKNREAIKC